MRLGRQLDVCIAETYLSSLDVPAGDIGVGGRASGYLFGQTDVLIILCCVLFSTPLCFFVAIFVQKVDFFWFETFILILPASSSMSNGMRFALFSSRVVIMFWYRSS